MKVKSRFLSVAVLFLLFAQQARANHRFIVRIGAGLPGIQRICTALACTVTRGLDGTLGQLFLVSVLDSANPDTVLQLLQSQNGVSSVELDIPIKIPQIPDSNVIVPRGLYDWRPFNYFGATVWNGYANQPAAQVIGLNVARTSFNVLGSGIVGVIDTGIDPSHPALQRVVVIGYDFTRDTRGIPAESSDLTQPVSPTATGTAVQVNDSTAAVLDQNSADILTQYAAFGHGTMVSGVIHLVAPNALIMPLKAFRADGTSTLSDILRAIYYGTQNGAKILNMSFSTPNYSKELQRALQNAAANGVISVGSAGNDGQEILVYPAALDDVMGVASTGYLDERSWFSNYGRVVWVAAPGEAIISPYPFGTYAASWGTSFSAPFVSGTAALLLDVRSDCNQTQAAGAISNARYLGPELGYGRLDVYQAVGALIHSRGVP
ncbi:MAG: hypothetical protein DMG97_18220 [Acidobacteria bacterium]|nr:MAG: hypothetical protein DMG97_18220 [Acidobacteriota bacterium]